MPPIPSRWRCRDEYVHTRVFVSSMSGKKAAVVGRSVGVARYRENRTSTRRRLATCTAAGLTSGHRPLYSAGFATHACRRSSESPCGGIGRRARLKIEFRKECWFDSGQGHQLGCSSPFQSVRNRPCSARQPLKNRPFCAHRCSSPFVLIRSQPSDLLVLLLVSCWYRENKRSRRLSLFRMKGI
jgi:hypothetical protein